MFNISNIQTEFQGLVGIRPTLNPDFDVLTDFATSESGLFLDDVEHYKTEYWVKNQDYIDATTEQLNDKMAEIEKSVISSVMHQVFIKPSYTDKNRLFVNPFSTNETEIQINDQNQFYGYKLDLLHDKNVAVKITKLLLEFSGEGDVEIGLYHSTLRDPITTETVTIALTDDYMKQVAVDWVIDGSTTPYKGFYFIGYYKPNNTLAPYKREYEIADTMSCFSQIEIERITINPDFTNLENIENVSEHNGLNLDLIVYDDYTDLIIQNKFLFARAIQLQWAMQVMTSYIVSLRSNREQRIASDLVNITLLAIDGQRGLGTQRVVGIREMIVGQIQDLQKTLKELREGYFGEDDGLTVTTVC